MRRAFARCVAGTAFLALTAMGGPAYADGGDAAGVVAGLTGIYPLALAKEEVGGGVALGGGLVDVPPVSLTELDDAGALAATALGAAAQAAGGAKKVCLPYTVHGVTRVLDNFQVPVIDDYVRFRLLWCEDEFRAVQPGEGYCKGAASVLDRVGVSRCWWQLGLAGGSEMSFISGGDYHVTLGVGTVATPVQYATVRVDFSGGWRPGSDIPECWKPALPYGWTGWCDIYVSSNW